MPEITKLKTTPIDDKYWEVQEDFIYETSIGILRVEAGFKTDYASVPRIFRNIINSYGKHGKAAVIHDWLYANGYKIGVSREQADKIFLEIMEECEVNIIRRKLMFRLVRIFGAKHYKKGE